MSARETMPGREPSPGRRGWLLTICLAAALGAWTAGPAHGGPVRPAHGRQRLNTYWYRLSVQVDRASLPPGVVVEVRDSAFADRIELRWSNRSAKPLLLINRQAEPIDWLTALPRGALPIYKLVTGRAFEWTNEGWRDWAAGISTDELYAALRLRPFEIELRQRPRPSGQRTITRQLRIPYYVDGKRHELTGTVEFEVDFDRGSQRTVRERLAIPTPAHLVYKKVPNWVGGLSNPGKRPIYFFATYAGPIEWIGTIPPNEIPCYRLERGRVAYTITPSHSVGSDPRQVSRGWVFDRGARFVELPLTWFAARAGASLELAQDYDRPKKLAVPGAQVLRVPVRLDGREHEVRLRVNYTLNPQFAGRVSTR